jgi:hypothetical protein
MKLSPKSFGLACGALWSGGMAFMTVLNLIPLFKGYAGEILLVIKSFYPGFSISWPGVLVGAIYGFIDGFIGGWLFAWVYNRFSKDNH